MTRFTYAEYNDSKTTSFRLTVEELAILKELARRKRRSMRSIISDAIREQAKAEGIKEVSTAPWT